MSLNIADVKQELLKYKGQAIDLLSGGGTFELVDITDQIKTSPGEDGEDDYPHPMNHLEDFVSALATGKAVSNDMIVGQKGSFRGRIAALLACHPEIYWAKKSKIYLIWRPKAPHVAGIQVKLTAQSDLNNLVVWEKASTVSKPETDLPDNFNFDFDAIRDAIQDSGLLYSEKDLYAYHLKMTALADKHFVILSGISGTGKSELARAYANAVYGADAKLTGVPYFLRLEVEADWQSTRPLLGYFNHLTGNYERKPFLDLLIKADEHARYAKQTGTAPKPFFVCLDEMNIARVEYYFSRLLSAMESGDPIHLHSGEADSDGIPRSLTYPTNLYLTGTINTDETTFAVSDKVLDRAFVQDLSSVDLDAFVIVLRDRYPKQKDIVDEVYEVIHPVQKVLAKRRFHMGYRTIQEIMAYVVKSQEEPDYITVKQALDQVLASKGLVKLRGDDRLKSTLDELVKALDKLSPTGICRTRISEMLVEIQDGLSQFGR